MADSRRRPAPPAPIFARPSSRGGVVGRGVYTPGAAAAHTPPVEWRRVLTIAAVAALLVALLAAGRRSLDVVARNHSSSRRGGELVVKGWRSGGEAGGPAV